MLSSPLLAILSNLLIGCQIIIILIWKFSPGNLQKAGLSFKIFSIITLGFLLGTAFNSYLFYLGLILITKLNIRYQEFALLPEILATLSLAYLVVHNRTKILRFYSNSPSNFCFYKFSALTGFATIISAISYKTLIICIKKPLGDWDAWAIWNLKAKAIFKSIRLFPESSWLMALEPSREWTHNDYPLFLPISIVRSWNILGTDSRMVPLVEGWLISVLSGLLILLVCWQKNWWLSIIVSLIYLTNPNFINFSSSQYADIALGSFLLLTIYTFQNTITAEDNESRKFWMILSLIFGLASAWTKNEGLICLSLISICYLFYGLVCYLKQSKLKNSLKDYISKLKLSLLTVEFYIISIGFLALLHFKIFAASGNDFINNSVNNNFSDGISTSIKIFDTTRYQTIFNFFYERMLIDYKYIAPLCLLVFLVSFAINFRKKLSFNIKECIPILIWLCILSIYFFIFIVTPKELNWHLNTAANRLLLQIYPLGVYGAICFTDFLFCPFNDYKLRASRQKV